MRAVKRDSRKVNALSSKMPHYTHKTSLLSLLSLINVPPVSIQASCNNISTNNSNSLTYTIQTKSTQKSNSSSTRPFSVNSWSGVVRDAPMLWRVKKIETCLINLSVDRKDNSRILSRAPLSSSIHMVALEVFISNSSTFTKLLPKAIGITNQQPMIQTSSQVS